MDEEKQNEQDQPISEELDFTKPDFQFIPKGSHGWRQQGPYLVCKSCELDHAVYIGIEHLMIGVDEKGMPILKVRT